MLINSGAANPTHKCGTVDTSISRNLMYSQGLVPRMAFQHTIARPVQVSGIGLHSAVPVNLRILPANTGTGIVFRRTDLDNFEIAARWQHVARVSYATSLMRQGVLISTTEHLLSA